METKTALGVVVLVTLATFAGYVAGGGLEVFNSEGDEGPPAPQEPEPTANTTALLKVNSTGENRWVAQKFQLENDTGMYMEYSFYSEYETQQILFESMYLVNLDKEAQWEEVYSDTRVYAGDNIDRVYGHGNLGPVNESYERTGSATSGTWRLRHMWLGFTLEAGTWYFVFETNGPHEMSFMIVFEAEILVLEQRAGNDTAFAYDTRDFSGDFKGGFAGGNFNSGGSLTQTANPWMLATYWAEDSSVNTGATRLSFESPNNTSGTRTYVGAGSGIRYDEGDFTDPLLGEEGVWYFEIQLEAKSDVVFLCGAGVELDF